MQRYGLENAGYGSGWYVEGAEKVLLGDDLHRAYGGFGAIADAVLVDDAGVRWLAQTKTAVPHSTRYRRRACR